MRSVQYVVRQDRGSKAPAKPVRSMKRPSGRPRPDKLVASPRLLRVAFKNQALTRLDELLSANKDSA